LPIVHDDRGQHAQRADIAAGPHQGLAVATVAVQEDDFSDAVPVQAVADIGVKGFQGVLTDADGARVFSHLVILAVPQRRESREPGPLAHLIGQRFHGTGIDADGGRTMSV